LISLSLDANNSFISWTKNIFYGFPILLH
jgi:hypothetical protein